MFLTAAAAMALPPRKTALGPDAPFYTRIKKRDFRGLAPRTKRFIALAGVGFFFFVLLAPAAAFNRMTHPSHDEAVGLAKLGVRTGDWTEGYAERRAPPRPKEDPEAERA